MTKYDPTIHHRRSIRLKDYDYRQAGAYFVTICAQQRATAGIDWFGSIAHGTMHLNAPGQMVRTIWDELPRHYSCPPSFVNCLACIGKGDAADLFTNHVGSLYQGLAIDTFIIMPDHLHGIIVLTGAGPLSLPDVVQRFKSLTTTRYRHGVAHAGWPPFPGSLWQRNYYERVIRDADEWNQIRTYIVGNPARWETDCGRRQ